MDGGAGDLGYDFVEYLFGGDLAQATFGVENKPMPHDGSDKLLDVVGDNIISAEYGRHGLRAAIERDLCPRAASEG